MEYIKYAFAHFMFKTLHKNIIAQCNSYKDNGELKSYNKTLTNKILLNITY